jgi:adenosylcobinamide kinase/adenosylcobinamide-phosphate guanylyltransferase
MFEIVTGGSGSGKSAFAESEILRLGSGTRIYLATMMRFDEESKKRIARHRLMRKDKEFETIECYTHLKDVTLPEDAVVLLECMSNLTANEMFAEDGAGDATVQEILSGIRSLLHQAKHLVVVTNEIFSDGYTYPEETRLYQEYLGKINREMGKMADQVVEVVYGIPVYVKKYSGKEVTTGEHH